MRTREASLLLGMATLGCLIAAVALLGGASNAAASPRRSSAVRSGSSHRLLVIINDDFGGYQLATENWPKYPSTVRAETHNPISFRAPNALEGGVPDVYSEFDGGLELIYALRDPSVKVIGVTTQYGISSAPDAFTEAHEIVKAVQSEDPLLSRHIPILRGALDAGALGHPTPASRFIDREVMTNCGRVEIIDTAPLTNTATAMMHQSRLARCWKQLWMVTGDFKGTLRGVQPSDFTRFSPHTPGININGDLPATRYVLAHGGSFPIIPNELEDDTWMTKTDFQRLAASHSELAKFVTQQNLPYYDHYFVNNPDPTTGPPPDEPGIMFHGTIGVAFAIDHSFSAGVTAFDSAVAMRWAGAARQWVFALSRNPRLPKHLVYAQLSPHQTRRMHKAIFNRLR